MLRLSCLLLSAVSALGAHAAPAAPSEPLTAVLARWDQTEHPDLCAVVVMQQGQVVAERYYNGATREELHDVRSAGKSVTALLVGIARDQGRLQIDQPVQRYWKQAAGSAIGPVALRDVLSMRSGLAADDEEASSPGNEDRMDAAGDPKAFVLKVPRAAPPGTEYRYNSLTSYVAGVVVTEAVGKPMDVLARQYLFAPLGIQQWRWARDASGITKGQGNLSLRARDFAFLGEMVRNDGVYQGKRIVSAAWLRDALTPHVAIGDSDPYADGYGYYWYAKTHDINGNPVQVRFASGNGGNKIYVVPSRQMVVAITSSAYGKGYGQRRSEAILKALLAVTP